MTESKLASRLGQWLGPPAPFQLMLLSFACLFVASYVFAFPNVEPRLSSIFDGLVLVGFGLGALFTGLGLLSFAVFDAWRAKPRDRILAAVALVLGFYLIHALKQLADDRTAFLETFATTLVGIIIALAIEAKAFGRPKG